MLFPVPRADLDDLDRIVGPLRPGLIPVPAAGQPGVCSICHSSAEGGSARCGHCRHAAWTEPPEVLPISLSLHGQVLHHHLWQYKDSPSGIVRTQAIARLSGLVNEFFARHATCVGPWDLVTCVPSPERVALEAVISQVSSLRRSYRRVLVARPARVGRSLDPSQFLMNGPVRRDRILLLDDTFVSGARLFGAVVALRRQGAQVVGPVVIGRHIQASWAPSARLLSWVGWRPWRADRCARCAGEREHDDERTVALG